MDHKSDSNPGCCKARTYTSVVSTIAIGPYPYTSMVSTLACAQACTCILGAEADEVGDCVHHLLLLPLQGGAVPGDE